MTILHVCLFVSQEIPSDIFYCEQLQTLKLRNNPLKIVRPEIGQLSNLRTLIMSFGLLMSLPAA